MKLQITKKTIFICILIVFFVFIDKLFKTLCLKGFLNKPLYVIGNIFSLHSQPNPNIAFSIPLSGELLTLGISILILFLISWWIFIYYKKPGERKILPALSFLIIGAGMNLTDRIRYGYVIDYFDLRYFTIFNVADILITSSILLMIIYSISTKNPD